MEAYHYWLITVAVFALVLLALIAKELRYFF